MPPERGLSSNATGRQKSCAQCVKSKRRCDLQQPSCLRCVRQHFTCTYPSRPPLNGTLVAEADSPMPDSSIVNSASSFDIVSSIRDHEDIAIQGHRDITIQSHQDIALLDVDLDAGIESIGFLQDLLNPSPMPDNHESALPLTRSARVPQRKECSTQLTPASYARIRYAIDRMKQAPATMVLENQTPWSHPLLYEDHMPRAIQDAHATCALYIARNEINSTFFARHVTERVQDLIKTPTPATPLELVARAHALLLYQTMHAFSGDIRLAAHVESTFPHIEASIYDLYAYLQQDSNPETSQLALYPATTARQAWKSFILQESCQRTLLILCQFMVLLHLLQGRSYCSSQYAAVTSRITSSAHLWNASSSIEFSTAWNEKPHFLVEDLDFTELLETGQPDDIDDFGRMILVTIMGSDDMKGWFHARGENF